MSVRNRTQDWSSKGIGADAPSLRLAEVILVSSRCESMSCFRFFERFIAVIGFAMLFVAYYATTAWRCSAST
jgi:hypothetical protein